MEYDGATSDGKGVTLRGPVSPQPDSAACFLACTNHFRERGELHDGGQTCSRYAKVTSALMDACGKREKLGVEDVWRIAASVNVSGAGGQMLTYHTIVFEPNKGVLHVATANATESAGKRTPVTVDLQSLLHGPTRAAAR